MTTYLVTGLNQKKFMDELVKLGINLSYLEILSHNQIKIGVESKWEKSFIKLTQKYNYQVKELSLPKHKKFLRLVKKNISFFACSLIVLLTLPVFSMFVFKTEIYGLENISKEQVLEVLNNNGYSLGKLKKNYDLDKIQNVLVSNINKISLASAIIKGNTLIININEKIDNSKDIYDYKPVVAPIDCIIESVDLISGSLQKKAYDSVRCGDIIVSPNITSTSNQILSVPARAVVRAKFDLSSTIFVSQLEKQEDEKKIVEENRKKLYNKLSSLNILGDIQEKNMENDAKYGKYYTIVLSGEITF